MHVVVASLIARRKEIVPLETLHARLGTAPRVHAILSSIRTHSLSLCALAWWCENVTIPDLLVADGPSFMLPSCVVGACRVAAGPILIFPKTCEVWVRTTLSVPAILPAAPAPLTGRLRLHCMRERGRKHFALPHLLIADSPCAINP